MRHHNINLTTYFLKAKAYYFQSKQDRTTSILRVKTTPNQLLNLAIVYFSIRLKRSMKTLNLAIAILVLAFPFIVGAQPQNLPVDGQAGKCYAQCYIQDQYEILTEQVKVKDETVVVDVTPPTIETIQKRVLLRPAVTKRIPTPPVYETISEQVLIEPEQKEYKIIPAKYESYTERIEIKPESKRIILAAPNRSMDAKGMSLVSAALPYLTTPASYSIERIPMEYDTETEEILVRPESKKWIQYAVDKSCLHQDPEECKLWGLVEMPAEYQTITRRKAKGCPTGYLPSRNSEEGKEECVKISKVAATYSKPKVTEPQFIEEVIPAEYMTVTKKREVSPASVEEIIIPAKYKTITKQVLKEPAGYKEETVPAEYGMVEFSVRKNLQLKEGLTFSPSGILSTANLEVAPIDMDTPSSYTNWEEAGCPTGYLFDEADNACKRILSTPAEYRTITKRVLKEKGGFTDFREVLCPGKVSNAVQKIQKALKEKGYNPGPIDNIMGPKTRAALTKFQEENSLPYGNLNLETLTALGIQ